MVEKKSVDFFHLFLLYNKSTLKKRFLQKKLLFDTYSSRYDGPMVHIDKKVKCEFFYFFLVFWVNRHSKNRIWQKKNTVEDQQFLFFEIIFKVYKS